MYYNEVGNPGTWERNVLFSLVVGLPELSSTGQETRILLPHITFCLNVKYFPAKLTALGARTGCSNIYFTMPLKHVSCSSAACDAAVLHLINQIYVTPR